METPLRMSMFSMCVSESAFNFFLGMGAVCAVAAGFMDAGKLASVASASSVLAAALISKKGAIMMAMQNLKALTQGSSAHTTQAVILSQVNAATIQGRARVLGHPNVSRATQGGDSAFYRSIRLS